jgi:DNA-binding response OmpR family regulator
VITTSPAAPDQTAVEVTPWVLLVLTDEQEQTARKVWEEAGFGVEVASSLDEALECLAVMTPALVVGDEMMYRRVET